MSEREKAATRLFSFHMRPCFILEISRWLGRLESRKSSLGSRLELDSPKATRKMEIQFVNG